MLKKRKNRKNEQKGAMLILLSLFVVIAVILFISLENDNVDMHMRKTGMLTGEAGAREAAYSLIDYASVQIEKDYTWKGNNFVNNITDKICGGNLITIKEDNGFIECEIKNKDDINEKSYACISFNPGDSRVDYISYNRIDACATSDDPDLKDKDLLNDEDYRTSQPSVPKDAVLIVAKGVCRGQRVYVEAMYKLSGYAWSDAPAIASKQIRVETASALPTFFKVDANDSGLTPQIYSGYKNDGADNEHKSILINKDNYNTTVDFNGGKINTNGKYFTVKAANLTPEAADNMVNRGVEKVIPDLTMDDIKSKLIRGASANVIKAGEYTIIADDKLAYKINGITQKVYEKSPSGVPIEIGGTETLEGLKMNKTKLYIDKSIKIEKNGSEKDFIVNGTAQGRVKVIMDGNETAQPYLLSETGGSIIIGGEFSGYGGVYTSGDITFQGKCMKNTTVDSGVSVFAEGTIKLEEIDTTKTDADIGNFRSVFRNVGSEFYYVATNGGGTLTTPLDSIFKSSLQGELSIISTDSGNKRDKFQTLKNRLRDNHNLYAKNFDQFLAWAANNFEISDNDSMFYGLIYSRKKFESYISGKFSLIGSIIVKSDDPDAELGKLIFANSKGISFIYDPAYLSIFKDLFKNCTLKKKFENEL